MTDENISPEATAPPMIPVEDVQEKKTAPAKKKTTSRKKATPVRKTKDLSAAIAAAEDLPDFGDDDDEEELFVPRGRPRGVPALSPMQMRNRAAQEHDRNTEEFETYLSSLEFDSGNHSVTVHRVEPEYDVDSGKRIAGYLEKFNRAITFEEIRSKYGGGKYRFIIHGPGQFGKPVVKANKVHEIAGDPILVNMRKNTSQQNSMPSGVENLVRDAISTSEKQVDRLMEENKSLQQLMFASALKKDDGLKEAILSMQPQFQQQVTEERRIQEQRMLAEREERRREQERLQQLMLEERRAAEKAAEERRREEIEYRRQLEKKEQIEREERRREQELARQAAMEEKRLAEKAAEARLVAEREERRREKEIEDRRHREMIEMIKMQAEREKEERRMELERIRLEQREQADSARQQFELQLKMVEKQEQDKEARSMKWSEFQHAMQQQQMTMMQQMAQMQIATLQQSEKDKVAFLQTQMQLLQKKSDPFEDMMKVKQFMDVLSGNNTEGDSRETWEKVLDRLSEGVPGLVAAAGLMKGASSSAKQIEAPTEQRVLPGSIAVVDEGEVAITPRQARRARRRRAETSATSTAKEPDGIEQESENAEIQSPQAAKGELGEDFTFPEGEVEPEQALEMLVKDLEIALRKEFTPDQMRTEVIDKFPSEVRDFLTAFDASVIIGFLEDKAPSDWRINSLDGQKKLVALHQLLTGNKTD